MYMIEEIENWIYRFNMGTEADRTRDLEGFVENVSKLLDSAKSGAIVESAEEIRRKVGQARVAVDSASTGIGLVITAIEEAWEDLTDREGVPEDLVDALSDRFRTVLADLKRSETEADRAVDLLSEAHDLVLPQARREFRKKRLA